MATSLVELLAVFSLLGGAAANPLNLFGPYSVYAEKGYPCGPKESSGKMKLDLKATRVDMRKQNALQLITVSFNTTTPLVDEMWGRARIDGYSNGEWKPNALLFAFQDHGCSNLRTHIPQLFNALFKKEGEGKECSVRPMGLGRAPISFPGRVHRG
ncbi:uncharacterized protein LOC113205151 isoform X2 [Frankliniella occidentalis]|uniref:Uncharacterized protein LOC113205151 isoform X2 n=1 Tax=Frankliniella occidentalis TaxID=133901 RepID=A0A6J1S5G1_FRAOC|nr:uncharacterized protein LOC113205151 isoform X2 [Frankliniella occidentalis]